MVAAAVKAFGGMVPIVDDRLLPDTAATYSENCYLYSGVLQGFPEVKRLHDFDDPATSAVFRLPESYDNAGYLYGGFWMEFQNPDTNVIRAPVFGDTYDRFYWASTSDAPLYNTRARIENGDAPWLLGVPLPSSVSVSPSGGVGAATVRTYGVTHVSAYGEEGPMKVTDATAGKVDDTWALTFSAVSGTDDGGVGDDRNIIYTNIYRTVVGSSGVATYFFVAQVAGSATTYNDTDSDDIVSANAQLESQYWSGPPSDLEGWVVMSNGIVAGWRENEVWFSEPYRPHAWPASYAQTVEYPILGLGVVNQTLVVCTAGYPVTMTGNHPAYMNSSKLNAFEPCVSRGSIVSAPEGVYYASPNGLVLVNVGSADNITRNLVSRDRWQQLTRNTQLRAARLGTAYYAFGSVVAGAFEDTAFDVSDATGSFTDEDISGALLGIFIDVQNQRVGFNLLSSEDSMLNVMNDPWSGELFLLRNGGVDWIDQTDPASILEPFVWRSKIFQNPAKKNIGAMRVYFEAQDGVAEDDYGDIIFYANGEQVFTRALARSGELMRLPSGFKYDYWQFEIAAQLKVFSVEIGSTPKDLRSVS